MRNRKEVEGTVKPRFLCLLLIPLLLAGLCGCNQTPPPGSSDVAYDPAPYVYFFNPDKIPSLSWEDTAVSASLHNDSAVKIFTGSQFKVLEGYSNQIGAGVSEITAVESGKSVTVTFDLSNIPTPPSATYTISLPCTWTAEDGTQKSFDLHFYFFRQPQKDTEPQPPATENDLLKTPIDQLTPAEQESLAEYLFENYIPCSYGIFSQVKDLSPSAIWSSVEALNRTVDKDESETSRTLDEVLKKVSIYYPGASFDPEKVRVYDKATKTFFASPPAEEEYVFLSYEVNNGRITIHYEDKPDPNDPQEEPVRYATTLKNSATEGYFSFISSVRTGAAG